MDGRAGVRLMGGGGGFPGGGGSGGRVVREELVWELPEAFDS